MGSPLGARALEDTVCYVLGREHFRSVLTRNPKVAGFVKTFLSRKFRSFSELMRKPEIVEEGAFARGVGELVIKRPVTCLPDASILSAVTTMESNGVGSIVAARENGEPLGIFTSKDLRRVVITGSKSEPVSRYMSSPVMTVGMNTHLLDAYSIMMNAEIDHLVVADDNTIRGVVTSKDILTQFAPASSLLTFYRKILKASDVEELKAAFTGVQHAIASLSLRNLRFYELCRIITTVHDTVVKEVLHFAGQEHPPGDFLWLHMGSSGRMEQAIATEQDNAILCRGVPPRAFAEAVTEILGEIGIPTCTASYMASDERWNAEIEVWKGYFKRWFSEPTPDHLHCLTVFLDIRPIYGDMGLYEELLNSIHDSVTNQAIRYLAHEATSVQIPIGTYGIKNLERGFNLKECGIYPIVSGIRVMVLENRVLEVVNTKERIEALHAMSALSGDLHSDLLECYEFLQGLNVRHQSRAIMECRETDIRLGVQELDKMDLLLLKEALKVIASFHSFLKRRYGVERGL